MTDLVKPLPHARQRGASEKAGASTLAARRGGAAAVVLAFIWPGLGHLAIRRWRRAIVLAAPPAVVVAAGVALVLADPAAAALTLLAPATAMSVLGLVVIHAAWRAAAIVDTWRLSRSRSPSVAVTAVAALAIVVAVHIGAAALVSSFATAGAQIFQGDRPTGGAVIDDVLGGGGAPDAPGAPPGAGSGDTNGDGVVDWNDDGWVEDDPGDGWEGPDYDPDGPAQPELPPHDPDEPAITPPPLTPDDLAGGHPGEGPINVLFVGLDSGLGRTHSLSDTLILASYHPGKDKLTMISIPRDTGRLPLYTGGTYPRRINTFLSYARANPRLFPEGPIAALMREVGYVLGTRVHYYAATDLDGLPRVVDLVGGIDAVLERPIADPRWNLYLEPGVHHLNGETVMPFVRSRYGPGNSDWQRARRQQQVIRAVAARVKNPSVALRLPQIIDNMSAVVRTNVPRDRVPMLLRILERANDASAEHIVLSPNAYARRIPVAETGGRYMTELVMPAIRKLSLRVFGSYSRYD